MSLSSTDELKTEETVDKMDVSDVAGADETGEKGKVTDVKGDGGILKEILKEGTGWEKPNAGCDVEVHYVGTLLDGTKFDASRDRNETFKFQLGKGQVIKGWDETVATMKKGEICKVTLKSNYAYGESGSPPKIPPNATLVFEIELINFTNEKDLTNDGGVLKKVLTEGNGWETAGYESHCKFHLKCKDHKGTVFIDTEKELTIGDEDIPSGLLKALESMKSGEVSKFTVKSSYGYGAEGNKQLNIPPHTDLVYELHMKEFKKGTETWQLKNFNEKLEFAVTRKTAGNSHFENNRINLAIEKYNKALDVFKYESESLSSEEKEKINKQVKIPTHLNLAACYSKTKEHSKVIENCNKALEIDSTNVKALWRRGVARTENGDWFDAKADFTKALEVDPDNKAVKSAMAQLKKVMHEQDKKDKQRYKNLFHRLAAMESKPGPAVAKTEQTDSKTETNTDSKTETKTETNTAQEQFA